MASVPAVQLFVERARSANPDFRLTGMNAAVVAAICRRLDGLPLALELAAARIKLLPPTALLGRLDRALPLLTGGARDLPERQRTLSNTIAWSYDLLSQVEQGVFRRLSVFVGGGTLDALAAICAADCAPEVLDTVESLVDKSLLRIEGQRHRPSGQKVVRRRGEGQAPIAKGEADSAQGIRAKVLLPLPVPVGTQPDREDDIAQRSPSRRRRRATRRRGGDTLMPAAQFRRERSQGVQPLDEQGLAEQAALLGRGRRPTQEGSDRGERPFQVRVGFGAGAVQQVREGLGGLFEDFPGGRGRMARGAVEPVHEGCGVGHGTYLRHARTGTGRVEAPTPRRASAASGGIMRIYVRYKG